ncbi:hypothetical protein HNP46_006345 [Pseudomonas nitritireducens]|uniref:Uncharacterized protein n=1 Tax=Pseudomonas nitroreducens TaxID=46680 RepID=A0A7W7KR40_PSENT|nr:hypothetical protein [Pseudomonas nitritireducens]MBB4867432.1 hypothetical protein [Pseudomonas nitritireducens]
MANEHLFEAIKAPLSPGIERLVGYFHDLFFGNATPMPAKVVASIPDDDISAAFVTCFYIGHVETARLCYARLQGDMIDLKVEAGVANIRRLPTGISGREWRDVELDLEKIDMFRMLGTCRSNALTELMAITQDVTGQDLLKPGFFSESIAKGPSFAIAEVESMPEVPAHASGFCVPTLTEEGLTHPDLAVNLYNHGVQPGVDPAWFSTMFCLADEATIAQHPEDLLPIDRQLSVQFGNCNLTGPELLRRMDDPAWIIANQDAVASWAFVARGHAMTAYDAHLVHQLVDSHTLQGNHPEGLVLCKTTAPFLVRQAGHLEYLTDESLGVFERALCHFTPYDLVVSALAPVSEVSLPRALSRLGEFLMGACGATAAVRAIGEARVRRYAEALQTVKVSLEQGIFRETVLGEAQPPLAVEIKMTQTQIGLLNESGFASRPGMNLIPTQPIQPGSCWKQMRDFLALCQPGVSVLDIPVDISDESLFDLAIVVGMNERGMRQEVVHGLMRERDFQSMIARCKEPDHWGVMHCIYGDLYMEPYLHELPNNRMTQLSVQGFEI